MRIPRRVAGGPMRSASGWRARRITGGTGRGAARSVRVRRPGLTAGSMGGGPVCSLRA